MFSRILDRSYFQGMPERSDEWKFQIWHFWRNKHYTQARKLSTPHENRCLINEKTPVLWSMRNTHNCLFPFTWSRIHPQRKKMCFKCINTYILFLFYFNSNIGRLCNEMYLHTMCIESTNKIYVYKDKKQRHESILKAHIFMHISFYLVEYWLLT